MKKTVPALLLALLFSLSGCESLPGGNDSDDSTTLSTSSSTADDRTIESAVQAALRQDELLAAADIDVSSQQGVVTLSGNVPNAQAFNRAISVASRVPGVKRPVKAFDLVYP